MLISFREHTSRLIPVPGRYTSNWETLSTHPPPDEIRRGGNVRASNEKSTLAPLPQHFRENKDIERQPVNTRTSPAMAHRSPKSKTLINSMLSNLGIFWVFFSRSEMLLDRLRCMLLILLNGFLTYRCCGRLNFFFGAFEFTWQDLNFTVLWIAEMYDFFEIFANGEDVIGDWMKSSGKKKIDEGPEKLRIQSMNGKVSKWINDNIII